jgi:hypothetical protein
MPWEFYDTFDENDRRRALAQAEYTSKSGATVDLRASGDVGALPLKYGIDPEATGTWAGNDKVLDRYAEVLLFKAEALNELNGPNQGSVDLINDIRKRAFGSHPDSHRHLPQATHQAIRFHHYRSGVGFCQETADGYPPHDCSHACQLRNPMPHHLHHRMLHLLAQQDG